jgi:hypothetical protein
MGLCLSRSSWVAGFEQYLKFIAGDAVVLWNHGKVVQGLAMLSVGGCGGNG